MDRYHRNTDIKQTVNLNISIAAVVNIYVIVVDALQNQVKKMSLTAELGFNDDDLSEIDDSTIQVRIHRSENDNWDFGNYYYLILTSNTDTGFYDSVRIESNSDPVFQLVSDQETTTTDSVIDTVFPYIPEWGQIQGTLSDQTDLVAKFATKEDKIYKPTTEPAIVTGTPNILTLDANSNRQAMFEPRLSVGTLAINIDFDLVHSNGSSLLLESFILTLTGTRIITFESDVLVSNASSIGVWDDSGKTLTLSCGTDDIIEFQIIKYASNYLLKVAEVAL